MLFSKRSGFVIPIKKQGVYRTSSENGSGILTISFDYAIKYLLKNKANFCVIEDFVSTILERAGYSKIKIVALEDPENQKSLAETRMTIPDLLVQDEKGRRYLIEIERGNSLMTS